MFFITCLVAAVRNTLHSFIVVTIVVSLVSGMFFDVNTNSLWDRACGIDPDVTIQCIVLHDMIISLQSGRYQYRSVVDALTNIARTEGPQGNTPHTHTHTSWLYCFHASQVQDVFSLVYSLWPFSHMKASMLSSSSTTVVLCVGNSLT